MIVSYSIQMHWTLDFEKSKSNYLTYSLVLRVNFEVLYEQIFNIIGSSAPHGLLNRKTISDILLK